MQIVRKVTFSENNAQLLAKIVLICVLIGIAATMFVQPVAAENTYRIVDGGRSFDHATALTEPAKILAEAGVKLGAADSYAVTQSDSGINELRVLRMQMITVNVDGFRRYAATYGQTVGELLTSLGVTLGKDDRTSFPLDAQTADGMVIDVTRVTHKTYTEDAVIPRPTTRYAVAGQDAEPVYLKEGRDGLSRRTVQINYENGVEVSRSTLIAETVIEPEGAVMVGGEADGANGTARVLSCLGTAYSCDGRAGITATGTTGHIGTIAVDPKVIPLGSSMYIRSDDGAYDYGFCTAEDTGGLIKGNRVDLYMNTTPECFQFGARRCTVYVLN